MKFPIIPIQGINGTFGQANVSVGTFFYSHLIKRIIKNMTNKLKDPDKYHSHLYVTENEKVRAKMKNPHINFSSLQV